MSSTDGDVKLSVSLTTEDIQREARALRKEIADIFSAAKGQDVSGQFQNLQTRMSKAAEQSRKLSKDMQSLAGQQIQTEEYSKLQKELDKLEGQFAKTEEKTKKFFETGGNPNTAAFRNLDYEAEKVMEDMDKVEYRMRKMREYGTAFTPGSNTAEYSKMAQKQAELSNSMTVMVNKAHELAPTLSEGTAEEENLKQKAEETSGIFGRLRSAIGSFGANIKSAGVENVTGKAENLGRKLAEASANAVRLGVNLAKAGAKNVFNGVVGGVKKLIAHLRSATGESSKFRKSFDPVKMLKMAVGIRSLFVAVRRLRGALKEGITNLAQWRDGQNETNMAISNLTSSLLYLKNSWGAAFAPLVSFVAPILTAFIDKLAAAARAVGAFFSAFTGKRSVVVAKKTWSNYAEGANKATKQVKKLKAELYGFDELNKQSDDSDSGSDGGAGGISPNDMFEEVPIDSILPKSVQDWIDRLKDAWKRGDWEGVGQVIAEGLNAAMKVADDWINNKFRPFGEKWANRIARILNGVVSGLDWKLLGKTLADGINAIFSIANTFLTTFNFKALGSGIGKSIKSWFDNVDWALIGETFANKWNALFHTIEGIVTTPGIWSSIGKSVGTLIKSWFTNIDLNSIATSVISVFNGVADMIESFLAQNPFSGVSKKVTDAINRILHEIDWERLGQQIGDLAGTILGLVLDLIRGVDWEAVGRAIGEFLGGINWADVFVKLAQILWEAIKACIEILIGMIKGAGPEMILAALGAVVAAIALKIAAATLFAPIIAAIGTALANVAIAIVTAIAGWPALLIAAAAVAVGAFALWFKNGGREVIAGFLQGIAEGMKTIGAWLKEHVVDPVVNGVKSLLGIKSPSTVFAEIGGYLIDGLLQGISDTWHKITDFLITAFENLKNFFTTTWDNIKQTASTKWTELKTSVSSITSNLKKSVTDKITAMKSSIATKMSEMKSKVSSVMSSMASTVSAKWSSIKSTAVSKWGSIKTYVITAWQNLKSAMANTSFASVGGNMVSGLLSGIQNGWSQVTAWVSNAAQGLANIVKGVLQIHSPSKVFKNIGKQIPKGLAVGVKDAQNEAVDTVAKVADNLKVSADEGLSWTDTKSWPKFEADQTSDSVSTSDTGSILDNVIDINVKIAQIGTILSTLTGIPMQFPSIAQGKVIPAQAGVTADEMNQTADRLMLGLQNTMYDVMNALLSNETDQNIKINISGREVFNAVVKENKRSIMRTGKSPLRA